MGISLNEVNNIDSPFTKEKKKKGPAGPAPLAEPQSRMHREEKKKQGGSLLNIATAASPFSSSENRGKKKEKDTIQFPAFDNQKGEASTRKEKASGWPAGHSWGEKNAARDHADVKRKRGNPSPGRREKEGVGDFETGKKGKKVDAACR